jgi:hypothetical protein
MRNVWVIFQKELNSYFVSPVAYLLLTMFAVIFGFFFWSSVGYFNQASIQAQMSGQAMPMSVNEYVIRPLLSNTAVIGLFFIPRKRSARAPSNSSPLHPFATLRSSSANGSPPWSSTPPCCCLRPLTSRSSSATATPTGSRWPLVTSGFCWRPGVCLLLEHLSPRSPEIRSLRAPQRLACASCSGSWNGPPALRQRLGRRFSRTCP